MLISVNANYSYDNRRFNEIRNIEKPTKCPRCHAHIDPVYIASSINSDNLCTVSYLCKACYSNFLSDYKLISNNAYSVAGTYFTYPKQFKTRSFDKLINDLSPNFVKIYNQALESEYLDLTEISGMAYRKSLEFLLKDYAIHKNPDKKDIISKPTYSLSNCISDHITATNLKNTSKITTWLGNDETHYTRVHNDKDINDLKKYLDSAVYFVMYDLVAEDANDLVNPQV